jgi:hypothetical protein
MLEAIFEPLTSAGYDLDLLRDLYKILFTDWTESELRFLSLFFMLVFGTQIRRMF